MGKFRQNPITKEWTIISTARAKRPVDVGTKTVESRCPFCPGNEDMSQEVYRLPAGSALSDWSVRVINNKYPVTDFHEVIIHSPDHDKDLTELPLNQVSQVLKVYSDRIEYYKKARQDFYIHIYNNFGKEAGASIQHPHSQLVVFNRVPMEVEAEFIGAKDFYDRKGVCPYCDLIEKALQTGERVVIASEFFAAITPFESEWPYEVSIFPRKHAIDFSLLTSVELDDLSFVLRQVLRSYKGVLSKTDHNFWIHSLPCRTDSDKVSYYHWHLDLIPRIKTLGGLELGAGIMVDDRVGPEQAAAELRSALEKLGRE